MAHLELYLIRHGIAEDRAKDGRDASRALTSEGIDRLREVAAGLAAIGVRWDLVLTSPYLRARQTADVLLREMGGDRPRLAVTDTLVPDADVDAVLAELPASSGTSDETRVALVSHEPLMGDLVGRLLGTGTSMPLKKGGVCRIDFEQPPARGPGTLKWLAPPKLLRKLDG